MPQLTYSAEPTFTDILNSNLVQDRPVATSLLKAIHHNSLYAAVRLEWFKMGWYQHGDTVPLPSSPADRHAYTAAETIWVPILGSSRQPNPALFTSGQDVFPALSSADAGTGNLILSPYVLKVDKITGVLTSQIYLGTSGTSNQGSVYVYAACQRDLGTLSFADGSPTFIDSIGDKTVEQLSLGGKPVTQSLIRSWSNNAKFGAVRKEVFDAGYFQDGDVIPLPVGVGPYNYSRSECLYLPLLASCRQPAAGFVAGQPDFPVLADSDVGSGHLTGAPFQLFVNGSTGALTCRMYYTTSGSVSQGTVRVVIVAQRQSVQAQN